MRLTTIWTIRNMAFAERIRRTLDWLNLLIASHLPKRIKFWAYIQAGSSAMDSNAIVPDQNFAELLKTMPGQPHS